MCDWKFYIISSLLLISLLIIQKTALNAKDSINSPYHHFIDKKVHLNGRWSSSCLVNNLKYSKQSWCFQWVSFRSFYILYIYHILRNPIHIRLMKNMLNHSHTCSFSIQVILSWEVCLAHNNLRLFLFSVLEMTTNWLLGTYHNKTYSFWLSHKDLNISVVFFNRVKYFGNYQKLLYCQLFIEVTIIIFNW